MPDDDASRLLATDAYRYALPRNLIATVPAEPADSARLMVVDEPLQHRRFAEFPEVVRPGDLLVVNETRVIRARLRGTRVPGGGAVEVLLLRPAAGGRFDYGAREWLALGRPGRRLRAGARVAFEGEPVAEVVAVRDDGLRVVRFSDDIALEPLLERYGALPLPPYVGPGDARRAARYQSPFARVPGSVAAPTASLHFTPGVLARLHAIGVELVPLVLDVGLGTFRPIDGASLGEHRMHAERYAVPVETADAIARAKREGRRVVAIGTTVLRALEASARAHGRVVAQEAETDLFIRPGFQFRVADALLTNFHLPGSTLLVLVAAFAGYDRIMAAYRTAIELGYRFYSFGDAMLLPSAALSDHAASQPEAAGTAE